jgi:hypothetical protein
MIRKQLRKGSRRKVKGTVHTFVVVGCHCMVDEQTKRIGHSEGATERESSEVGGSNRVTCSVK